jgi:2-polyprenyl-3-methyl-5-hydroxy-6-metoxy-1,4-benzoquinol methylase
MPSPPNYVDLARDTLDRSKSSLLELVGREALEETAWPVYMNTFGPAAYLGWSRIVHAQRFLSGRGRRHRVLDFGSGLGVMLPFLAQHFDEVVAFDLDPRPTALMVQEMGLRNVLVTADLHDAAQEPFDVIIALDVLEHVPDLRPIYSDWLPRTRSDGTWIISGPTENRLYRAMRKVARTTGEGHVRTIYDVFDAVPADMRETKTIKLPFGSPIPLFLVGQFDRARATT